MERKAVITSRRPNLRRALEAFMRRRGIAKLGYTGMAADFARAGHPDKIYYEKIRGWIDVNQGVPDRFWFWLDKTYKLTPKECDELWDAYGRDLFAEPSFAREEEGCAE